MPRSAWQAIPIEASHMERRDLLGGCSKFARIYKLADINYVSASREDKEAKDLAQAYLQGPLFLLAFRENPGREG